MARQDSLARAEWRRPDKSAERRPLSAILPPFSQIYQQHFAFVWSSARHLGVDAGALDDVVQEVFIVVHDRLHTVQRPEALRSWIYGVVRRVVSAHHRARKPEAQFENLEPGVPSLQTTPLDRMEQNAQFELLSSLLAELDPPKREVFILAELQEMPVPEIAQALDIPLNTAYSRLRAARQAFEAGLARRAARLEERGLR